MDFVMNVCLVLPLKEQCHMCLKFGVAESVINTSRSLVEFLIICFQETSTCCFSH